MIALSLRGSGRTMPSFRRIPVHCAQRLEPSVLSSRRSLTESTQLSSVEKLERVDSLSRSNLLRLSHTCFCCVCTLLGLECFRVSSGSTSLFAFFFWGRYFKERLFFALSSSLHLSVTWAMSHHVTSTMLHIRAFRFSEFSIIWAFFHILHVIYRSQLLRKENAALNFWLNQRNTEKKRFMHF